jgi:hypothetical protein
MKKKLEEITDEEKKYGLTEEEMNEICCEECGGSNIHGMIRCWFELDENGEVFDDPIGSPDCYRSKYIQEYWCEDCQKNIEITTKREFTDSVNRFINDTIQTNGE